MPRKLKRPDGTLFVRWESLTYVTFQDGMLIHRDGEVSICPILTFCYEDGKVTRSYPLHKAPKWMQELFKDSPDNPNNKKNTGLMDHKRVGEAIDNLADSFDPNGELISLLKDVPLLWEQISQETKDRLGLP